MATAGLDLFGPSSSSSSVAATPEASCQAPVACEIAASLDRFFFGASGSAAPLVSPTTDHAAPASAEVVCAAGAACGAGAGWAGSGVGVHAGSAAGAS